MLEINLLVMIDIFIIIILFFFYFEMRNMNVKELLIYLKSGYRIILFRIRGIVRIFWM